MILRKPYAIFIKFFRWFHVVITFLSAFLIYKTLKMTMFFSDYTKTNELINDFNVGDYITIYTFLIAFLVIVINIVLLSVMIVKKKPFVHYIYNLITYVGTIIIYGFALSALTTVSAQILEVTRIILIRDFLTIAMLMQIGTFVLAFVRATGFDIKKFDFGEDLEKLDIKLEDNEEFEVDVEFDGDVVKRNLTSKLRNAKYAIIENKIFVIVGSIILVSFISLIVYFSVGIYSSNVKEDEPFTASGVSVNVTDTFVTAKDNKGKLAKNNKALVILRMDIRTNQKAVKTFNTGLATLNIKDYSFSTTTDYISDITDLGRVYYNQTLTPDYTSYILVYEIPKALIKEKMEFKFNDNVSYIKGEVGAKNIFVDLKPIDIDEVKENASVNKGDKLALTDSVLGNSVVQITNYQLAKQFKINYNFCYATSKCIKSVEYINPTASSSYDKIIMKLEGTFTKDDTKNIQEMNDLYDFVSSFGILTYVIDGKTYTHPINLQSVNPVSASVANTYYIEVVPEVAKATNIYFEFRIRNQSYKYVLK